MNTNPIVIPGVVKPDGTLELEGKIPLAAGKVQVTVEPVLELPTDDPFFDLLKGIWEARAQAGLQPRSVEEVEAQRKQLREDSEKEIAEAIRLQEEHRQSRKQNETDDREAE